MTRTLSDLILEAENLEHCVKLLTPAIQLIRDLEGREIEGATRRMGEALMLVRGELHHLREVIRIEMDETIL